ncbi:MAG: hypothetical protein ABL900_02125 [Burkholderiaceae bacterium]
MLARPRFWWGLLIAVGISAATTLPALPSERPAHGRTLVAEYQLPLEAIDRYAALAVGAALEETRRDGSRFADLLPWVGPEQRAGAGRNPYTLVFTVDGSAQAAGEVFAQWQVGWELQEESPGERREVLMAVPGVGTTATNAHQRVTLTASSGPLSFRGERTVAPKLGLVYSRNLDVHDVRLQVWSGTAPFAWPAWPELPASSKTLLALCMACLLFGTALRLWPRAANLLSARPSLPASTAKASTAGGSSADTVLRPQAALAVAAQIEAPAAAVDVAAALAPDHEACVLATLERVLERRSMT